MSFVLPLEISCFSDDVSLSWVPTSVETVSIALERAPGLAPLYRERATLLEALGRSGEAMADFGRASLTSSSVPASASPAAGAPRAAAPPAVQAVPTNDWLHTVGNTIVDEAGNRVVLSGANWFGYNASERVFHGLWSANIETLTRQMAERGINIVRVPISTRIGPTWRIAV